MFRKTNTIRKPTSTSIPEEVVMVQSNTYVTPSEPSVVYETPKYEKPQLMMQAQGATLDNHNKSLVNRLTELRQKRELISERIDAETKESERYQTQQRLIKAKLQQINSNLSRKKALAAEYSKVIEETEFSYNRILESSMSLLTVLEKGTIQLQRDRDAPPAPARAASPEPRSYAEPESDSYRPAEYHDEYHDSHANDYDGYKEYDH